VLEGSQGSLYYPPEEIGREPHAWNGVPLVRNHPEADGQQISARDPDVLEECGLGHVYRTVANGKLTAEAWFDVDRVRRIDPRILERLRRGEPIEVSTGLFVDAEPAPEGATWNGRAYTHIARNYRPDHLAILPDQRGACSVADGCGVLVNEEQRGILARFLAWMGGQEESAANAAPRLPRSRKTGWWKPVGSGTGRGPAHAGAQAGFLIVTDYHRTMGADAAAQAQSGQNPPSWAVDDGTWGKAQAAAGESGHAGDWPYITAVYQRMGGTITTNRGQTMNRAQLIDWLTANCGVCRDLGKDALGRMNDKILQGLKTNAEQIGKYTLILNRLRTGNAEGDGEAAGVNVADLAGYLGITADPAADPAGFIAELLAKLDEVRAQIAPSTAAPATEEPVASAEGDPEEEDPVMPANRRKVRKTAVPVARQPTTTEWLEQAPAEVRSMVQRGLDAEKREKASLIEQLTANVVQDRRAATAKRLQARTLDDLREMLELRGAVPATEQRPPLWMGAAVPTTNTVTVEDDSEDVAAMTPPVINWGGGKQARA
jgi:hypothetical protein